MFLEEIVFLTLHKNRSIILFFVLRVWLVEFQLFSVLLTFPFISIREIPLNKPAELHIEISIVLLIAFQDVTL